MGALPWFHIAEPSNYLVITGAGIDGVRITKKAWIKPWQKVHKISVTPFDISLELHTMTKEKLLMIVPVVFTIGPEDNPDALVKYASLLTGVSDGAVLAADNNTSPDSRNHVRRIVKGIIEGETRVLVSTMTAEEVFTNRALFKQNISTNVQSELSKFGLTIYNSNVKDLKDPPGSEYFSYLSRKAHESASSKARIDASEARRKGEIGEKENEGMTKQQISKIDAETAILETERGKDKATAQASLSVKQAELENEIQLTKIRAKRLAESKDAELQKDVEMKRAEMELERLRATDVTKSKIAKESAQQKADADHYTALKKADAELYTHQKSAEAQAFETLKRADNAHYTTLKTAEATYYAQEKAADASYYKYVKDAEAAATAKKLEAEAIREQARAFAELRDVFGGSEGLLKYLMIERGVYTELAQRNAEAIKGLQPKINVWNTGPSGEGSSAADALAPIRNIFQALPPLFSTIQDQTGITPPNWIAQMPKGQAQIGATNGVDAGAGGSGSATAVKRITPTGKS